MLAFGAPAATAVARAEAGGHHRVGIGEIRLDAPSPGEPAEPDWIAGRPDRPGAEGTGLRAALRAAPDPLRAARLAQSVVEALEPASLDELTRDHASDLIRILAACCGTAPFLAPFLRRHPSWVPELVASGLERPRDVEALRASVSRALASAGEEPGGAEAALRRVKYFELTRLTVRDACPDWVPLEQSAVTLTELSQLADALLSGALEVAARRVAERSGPPRWKTRSGRAVELSFCVLGLGKLGSEELNFSSDVDLVYVYEAPPEPLSASGGETDLAPADYFTRLARAIAPIASDTTVDGFLYRIDLELRPEGSRGPLVLSDEALAQYYETSADTWEKAAFMKARPVAGRLELGWRAIRAISPMIYRSSMDFAAVAGIRRLKDRVEEAHGGSESGFNVKIDSGGIRDLEFIAQSAQLLHGGRIPQLRSRSTQATLENMAAVDLLEPEAAAELLDAYRFLRRVENRIQMEAERQIHRVPADPEARARLARATGFTGDDALRDFDGALAERRERVLRHFASTDREGDADQISGIFERNAPGLARFPTSRAMMEELAGAFARALASSPDREMALNNLDRFVAGLSGRSFYFQLLMDRPELVPRLADLFGASRFLSDILARHPRLIEPLFENPDRLLLSKEELRADLAALSRHLAGDDGGTAGDPETALAALRLFHHRQIANVGLLDAAAAIDRDQAEAALSDVADVCVEGALAFARQQLARRAAELPPAARDARFLVVGMGKLGSREMGYGSDLDLIFLYDLDGSGPAAAAAQDHYVRLAQRLISALHTPTGEGECYEIDARMRPSGNQGTLVTSIDAFRRYHDGEAQTWERQALLRARPVAGDPTLGAEFDALRRSILERPLPADARDEIHRIRRRMETELAREGGGRHDFKLGRGGQLDVENVVQLLRLQHGAAHPDLLDPLSTPRSIERLRDIGALDEATARTLSSGWEFLRRLAAGLRIVENRSISDLDEERGDLDGLARRLGYTAERRSSEARKLLLTDYRRHTEAIRRIHSATFGEDAPDGDAVS
jgi:glutamate-ammonia-ligase adenylyltransferase